MWKVQARRKDKPLPWHLYWFDILPRNESTWETHKQAIRDCKQLRSLPANSKNYFYRAKKVM